MKSTTLAVLLFAATLSVLVSPSQAWYPYHPFSTHGLGLGTHGFGYNHPLWSSIRHPSPSLFSTFFDEAEDDPFNFERLFSSMRHTIKAQDSLLNAVFTKPFLRHPSVAHRFREAVADKPIPSTQEPSKPQLDSTSASSQQTQQRQPQKTKEDLAQIAKFLDLFNNDGDLDSLLSHAPVLTQPAPAPTAPTAPTSDSKPVPQLKEESKPVQPAEVAAVPTTEAVSSSSLEVTVIRMESDDGVRIILAVPGADPKDFKLNVRTDPATSNHLVMVSSSSPAFSRTIALPSTVDLDGINARYQDGALTILAPKRVETPDSRPIPIQIEN